MAMFNTSHCVIVIDEYWNGKYPNNRLNTVANPTIKNIANPIKTINGVTQKSIPKMSLVSRIGYFIMLINPFAHLALCLNNISKLGGFSS